MTLYVIFAILIFIASILLVGVVLIQKSKGGGLASNMSGYNSLGGVRQTTEFVEKATWALAGFICLMSIASAFIPTPTLVQGVPQIKTLNATETQAPDFSTPSQQQPAGAAQQSPAQQEQGGQDAAPSAPAAK